VLTKKKFVSTKIDLSALQLSRLKALSLRLTVTKNELVRRAVDQFLDTCIQTSRTANKAQRIKSIVGIWADKAETINPIDFIKKQRVSRF
jgi:predicted DNA-binding protein